MKRVSASFLPPIALDANGNIPIYRQLYDWYRRAILSGQLRPGQRIPSTRSLAAELRVSRIPVTSAYEQLHAEGYFETFIGAGTCVARSIPLETLRPPAGKTRMPRRKPLAAKSRVESRVACTQCVWLRSPG